MKRLLNIAVIRGITYTMIGVLTLLIANNVLFLHTHITNDGSTVIHAHPFQKDGDPASHQHKHGKAELITFNNLSQLYLIDFEAISLKPIIVSSSYFEFFCSSLDYIELPFYSGRAPPFSTSI